jgi:3-deoxy-D-manno-octulosonic-acid transferase
VVEAFSSNQKVLVAGSTWPADEDILVKLKERMPELRLIIAPHEIGEDRVIKLCSRFGSEASRLSESNTDSSFTGKQVLVIDSIGLLSSLYRYGKYAYVGGGFGKGIHNTLEAAVYAQPLFFGPNYSRFREAVDMETEGCAFSIETIDGLYSIVDALERDVVKYTAVSEAAGRYVKSHAGATERILESILSRIGKS